MDVEAVVARRLAASTGLSAFLEVPAGEHDEFLTVEQTGGGGSYMESVSLDVDCWAETRKRAKAISSIVSSAVFGLDDEPNIFNPRVERTYRMNDPDTGKPRYVVGVSLWICE